MLKRYFKDNKGVTAIEFAFIAPIFLIMLLAGFEAGRYVMLINKVQSTAFTLANIVAQTEPASRTNACLQSRLTEDKLENILSGARELMRPFSYDDAQYKVFITALERTPSGMGVRWRKEYGTLADGVVSEVGPGVAQPCTARPCPATVVALPQAVNDALTAPLPRGGLQPGNNINNGENVMVMEMFYHYDPLFPTLFGSLSDTFKPHTERESIYFYSRLGKLEFLPPTYMPVDEMPCLPGGGAGA